MYADLEQLRDARWRLRFTRILTHPPERVWRALTEPAHLAHWFPTTVEGERAAGASLRFAFPSGEAPSFAGEMLAYEPPSLMEFRWGTDTLRLELRAVPGGSELALLHTFEDRGKAARDAAGWHVCLEALQRSLDGAENLRQGREGWSVLHARYAESFGPEAATIGPPEGFE